MLYKLTKETNIQTSYPAVKPKNGIWPGRLCFPMTQSWNVYHGGNSCLIRSFPIQQEGIHAQNYKSSQSSMANDGTDPRKDPTYAIFLI